MNYIFMIAMVILILSIIIGGIRGLVKTFFAAFSVIIALFIASQVGPYVGKVVQKTPVYTGIVSQIQSKLDKQTENTAEKVSEQIETIHGYPIPEFLKDALIENNNSQIYEALGISSFNQYVASYMACLIINAVSFLIIFILGFIIITIIEISLDLISKLPVLNVMNTLGGVVCGFVHGMMILWILGVIITVFSWTELGQYIALQINENSILRFIYSHNYLVSTLTNMGKMLF